MRSLVIAVVVGVSAIASAAFATENGEQHFPIGLQSAVPAILPPPGATEYYNYNLYYGATSFRNDTGGTVLPKFSLDVTAEAARALHTWPVSWNGFTLVSGGALNFIAEHANVPGAQGSTFGLGDPDFNPLLIAYTNHKTFWAYAGPNIWAAVGSYKTGQLVNPGLNYTSVDFEVSTTWLPSPRWEVSTDNFTGFAAGANPATHYRSGDTFSSDFSVGYRPFQKYPHFQLAVQGDVFTQWTDDSVSGARVGDGFRGRQVALGPQLRWDFAPGLGVLLKWQQEFAVENRPQGTKVWFEFATPVKF